MSDIKVVVYDPGHGGGDPGAVGHVVEKEVTLERALAVRDYINKRYKCEFILTRDRDVSLSLSKRVRIANDANADLFVSDHSNAGGGAGYEDFVFSGGVPNRTRQARDVLHDKSSAVWARHNRPNRGKKTAGFYVLRNTRMSAVLQEHGFVDNEADAKLLANDSFRQEEAEAIGEAIAEILSLPRKASGGGDDDTIYRVQVGAFSDNWEGWQRAMKLKENVKTDGFDAYIGARNDMFIVQIGAFGAKEKAEKLARDAEEKGYDTYISTQGLDVAKEPEKPKDDDKNDHVYRVIVDGEQVIALTGKDNAKQYALERYAGREIVLENVNTNERYKIKGSDDGGEDDEEQEEGIEVPEGDTPILGEPYVSVEQARKWAQARGAHELFVEKADYFWDLGIEFGIRPEVAYALSAKETAFKHHGGVVDKGFKNWGGIKTADGGPDDDPDAHERFDTEEEGIKAVFNHIAAYTGVDPLEPVHGRYHVVLTTSWAGSVETVERLGAKWATDEDYGRSLVEDYLKDLLSTDLPDDGDDEDDDGKGSDDGDDEGKDDGKDEIEDVGLHLLELLIKLVKRVLKILG